MTTLRTFLRDALKRKMHALLSVSDSQNDKKILKAHWDEMQKWCDVTKADYEYVGYRYALWKGETGAALKLLLSMIGSYDSKKHIATEQLLRKELLNLYTKFDWDHLIDNEKRYQQLNYPKL